MKSWLLDSSRDLTTALPSAYNPIVVIASIRIAVLRATQVLVVAQESPLSTMFRRGPAGCRQDLLSFPDEVQNERSYRFEG